LEAKTATARHICIALSDARLAVGNDARLHGHYLQPPQGVDSSIAVYESYVQFRWLSQVTPTLGLDLAVTPGVYSDFNQNKQ